MAHEFPKTPLNKVKRLPEKGHYDAASIYAVVDAALICSVGYVIDGQVYVTPTMHARDGDQILLHGSRASRMLRHLDGGGALRRFLVMERRLLAVLRGALRCKCLRSA